MKRIDIMETLVEAIEDTVQKEWRHDVVICGWTSGHIDVEIDGVEYVINLYEVKEGEHWSQYLHKDKKGEQK